MGRTRAALALRESPRRSRLAEWVIAITAASGALLEVIDTSIVNVALPDIQGTLGATLSEPAGCRPAMPAPMWS